MINGVDIVAIFPLQFAVGDTAAGGTHIAEVVFIRIHMCLPLSFSADTEQKMLRFVAGAASFPLEVAVICMVTANIANSIFHAFMCSRLCFIVILAAVTFGIVGSFSFMPTVVVKRVQDAHTALEAVSVVIHFPMKTPTAKVTERILVRFIVKAGNIFPTGVTVVIKIVILTNVLLCVDVQPRSGQQRQHHA